MGPREAALQVLIALRTRDAWPNAALKTCLSREKLDSRDAALASKLCYGVLQNRGKLDFYLKQLLTGKLRDLHPVVRDILHLGLYQILELDRIPDSAAVNESVELAKRYAPGKRSGALVNGVLRSAVRGRETLTQPTGYEEKYSHPEALIRLLKTALPKGTLEPMLIADNTAPPTLIQTNLTKITTGALTARLETEGVSVKPHRWMTDCLEISGGGSLEKLPAFRDGLFYVQDPASKLSILASELPKGANRKILDCCAAPGGKSFAAAIATGGQVTSCDVYPHKAELIAQGAARLGLAGITALCRDAREYDSRWREAFDAVIVDAPCSGLGIIRKKPDIRYKKPEEFQALPELQLEILKNQANYVRPGGRLVYSTCTVLPAENEQVVQTFLKERPDFHLEKLALPDVFPAENPGYLTLIPGQYDTDGFFICRMGRNP